ncbi:hypothetical protein PG993_009320 [Apiospora rasikravindrae]|uniref:Uncharacterized protein n=1 Tax=Apiospora rasikravindrae TaxID=990691 RepID=A0ABR1SKT1_9PEZI
MKGLEVKWLQERAPVLRECGIVGSETPELLAKEQKLPSSAHPFMTAFTTSAEKTTTSDTAVSQDAANVVTSNSVADGKSEKRPFLPSLPDSEAAVVAELLMGTLCGLIGSKALDRVGQNARGGTHVEGDDAFHAELDVEMTGAA